MKRLVAALGLLLIASAALAEAAINARRMGIQLRQGGVTITYSAADLLQKGALTKLDSGLPQRVVAQHFVYEAGRGVPLAVGGHSCKVVFDLWQGVYRVEYEQLGKAPTALAFRSKGEVLDRCLVMRSFPVGDGSAVEHKKKIYVGSLIELNPLSNSTVARIRRWLSRPRGEYNVESKSFFGS
ncbi:MAG TPA: hypothetical protein VFX59_03135, partial [Polyangiales bacterium]|nr:hypothetical protein [Polyangiales bacterium]